MRKFNRSKLGSLKNNIVSTNTIKRYEFALLFFFEWLKQTRETLATRFGALDEQVGTCIDYLWLEGEPKGIAGDLLSAFHHFVPALSRSRLPGAWRLFSAWGKHELPFRAFPLLPYHVKAMVMRRLRAGDLKFCVLLMIGFDCMLRGGELMSLQKRDFKLNNAEGKGVIELRNTKSGKRYGGNELVVIQDCSIVSLLSLILAKLEPGDFIFEGSYYGFRKKSQNV